MMLKKKWRMQLMVMDTYWNLTRVSNCAPRCLVLCRLWGCTGVQILAQSVTADLLYFPFICCHWSRLYTLYVCCSLLLHTFGTSFCLIKSWEVCITSWSHICWMMKLPYLDNYSHIGLLLHCILKTFAIWPSFILYYVWDRICSMLLSSLEDWQHIKCSSNECLKTALVRVAR